MKTNDLPYNFYYNNLYLNYFITFFLLVQLSYKYFVCISFFFLYTFLTIVMIWWVIIESGVICFQYLLNMCN